jgi:putative phosphoribosyl transferase
VHRDSLRLALLEVGSDPCEQIAALTRAHVRSADLTVSAPALLRRSVAGMTERRFVDRRHAGRVLADALSSYAGRPDAVVLGLPRGGVPVAREVADALASPLDVFCVRKLGVPGHAELAFGAIASGEVRVLNDEVMRAHDITAAELETVVARELDTIRRHEHAFRDGRPPLDPRGKLALIVDDGLATGATMRAAAQAARGLGADAIICAVPVAPPSAPAAFADVCDDFVVPLTPSRFHAVGQFYDDFSEVSDDEVRASLD